MRVRSSRAVARLPRWLTDMIDRILIDIASGFYVAPGEIPGGAVGTSVSVRYTAFGGVGNVTFGTLLPNHDFMEMAAIPSGLTLTDNGDSTATLAGTFSGAWEGRAVFYAWDSAGQSTKVESYVVIDYPKPLTITRDVNVLTAHGGPGDLYDYMWRFEPPLPDGWSFTTGPGTCTVHRTGGSYNGTAYAGYTVGTPTVPAIKEVSYDWRELTL